MSLEQSPFSSVQNKTIISGAPFLEFKNSIHYFFFFNTSLITLVVVIYKFQSLEFKIWVLKFEIWNLNSCIKVSFYSSYGILHFS